MKHKSPVAALLIAVLSALGSAQTSSAPKPTDGATPSATPAVPVGEVQGIVLMPDGKPAAKAHVALLPTVPAGAPPQSPLATFTDETGAFRFDVRTLKSFSIVAHLPPYAMLTQPRLAGGRRVTMKLAAGGKLSGQVIDLNTGRPLANVAIEAAEWDDSPYADVDAEIGVVRTTSDAKGVFTLTGLSSSPRLTVRARLKGFAAATVSSIPPSGLKFRLGPGHTLSGAVVDSAGRPVAKARVTLRPSIARLNDNVTLRTSVAGKFEAVGLANVPYDATITADGYAPVLKDSLSDDVSTLNVTLERVARVTGRFVDEEKAPIKGLVRLRSWSATDIVPPELEKFATVPTKADGTFELAGLKVGINSVDLRPDGFPRLERKIEIARAGETIALGDIKFEKGLTIRGRVSTTGDAPVAGARVTASRGPRGIFTEQITIVAQSGDDGRFELKNTGAESYQLSIAADGFARQSSKATGADENVRIVLKPLVSMTGRLIDAEGAPIPRGRVSAQKGADASTTASAVSTVDGRFTLEGGDTGDMNMSVTAEGFTTLSRPILFEPNADLGDVVLSRGLKIRGVVVDSKGTAIPGARVENQTTRQPPTTFTETDDKGQFVLTGLTEGRARIVGSHPQYSSAQTFVELKAGEEPEEAKLTLGSGARVEGFVRHRDGSAVAQAIVQLFPISFSDPTRPPANLTNALTQADGSFVFEHVFPGSMNLVLMTGQQGRYTNVDQTSVTCVEGETSNVNLKLRTTIVRGLVRRVSDPPGGLHVDVVGSNVIMSGGMGRTSSLVGEIPWRSGITEPDGRFVLKVAGPLSGTVGVSPVDQAGALLSKKVEIPDQDEFTLNVDLTGTRVSGRVIDAADSKPIGEANISFSRAAQAGEGQRRYWYARTNGSGAFNLEVEPGQYELSVGAEGYSSSAARKITVTTSEMTVDDVTLSHGGTVSGRVTLNGQPIGMARVDMVSQSPDNIQSRWTGPDGFFTIPGVPETGAVRIVASNEVGHAGALLLASGIAEPVEVKLVPAARIMVTVIGPKDVLAKTSIGIVSIDGFRASGFTRPDPNGRGMIISLPGDMVIRAFADDWSGETVVQTQSGQETAVVIELKPRKTTPQKQ